MAMQRVALPQVVISPPSALMKRTAISASASLDGSISAMVSAPIPVWRSASARACASVGASGRCRASNTMKSLPSPCILRKGIVIAAFIWGTARSSPLSGRPHNTNVACGFAGFARRWAQQSSGEVMRKRLENKIAIITGSGRGIGRACALRYGQEGAVVIVNDVNAENVAKVTGEIVAAGG